MSEHDRQADESVRETYSEYRDGGVRMAVIRDPDNDAAWICSSVTEPIDS